MAKQKIKIFFYFWEETFLIRLKDDFELVNILPLILPPFFSISPSISVVIAVLCWVLKMAWGGRGKGEGQVRFSPTARIKGIRQRRFHC